MAKKEKTEVIDEQPQGMTREVVVSDPLKGTEDFNPREYLRTVCNGVWRYICKDPMNFKEENFRTHLAKEFGMKENDLVYVVGNQTYKIVVI